MSNAFYRSRTNKVAGGICSAMAYRFNVHPFIVRFCVACAVAFFWVPFLVYLLAWIAFPLEKKIDPQP